MLCWRARILSVEFYAVLPMPDTGPGTEGVLSKYFLNERCSRIHESSRCLPDQEGSNLARLELET